MRKASALSLAFTLAFTAIVLAQRHRNEKDTLAVIFAITASLVLIWFLVEFELECRSRMQRAQRSSYQRRRRTRRKVYLGYAGISLLAIPIMALFVWPFHSRYQTPMVTFESLELPPEMGPNHSNPQVPKPAPEIIWSIRRLDVLARGTSRAGTFEYNPGVTVQILLKRAIDRPLFTIKCSLPCVVSRVQSEGSFAPNIIYSDRLDVARVEFPASVRLESRHEVNIDIHSRDKREVKILAVNAQTLPPFAVPASVDDSINPFPRPESPILAMEGRNDLRLTLSAGAYAGLPGFFCSLVECLPGKNERPSRRRVDFDIPNLAGAYRVLLAEDLLRSSKNKSFTI
jgi:hypothetical protein